MGPSIEHVTWVMIFWSSTVTVLMLSNLPQWTCNTDRSDWRFGNCSWDPPFITWLSFVTMIPCEHHSNVMTHHYMVYLIKSKSTICFQGTRERGKNYIWQHGVLIPDRWICMQWFPSMDGSLLPMATMRTPSYHSFRNCRASSFPIGKVYQYCYYQFPGRADFLFNMKEGHCCHYICVCNIILNIAKMIGEVFIFWSCQDFETIIEVLAFNDWLVGSNLFDIHHEIQLLVDFPL